jgi:uncharacterized protein YndB with AHSA1/START domain
VETPSNRVIATSRVLDAPRVRVFAAFADPVQLALWWGPKGFTNTFEEFSLQPGGHWRFVMHGPDGSDYRNESVFEEVQRPERIVFRHLSDHIFRMTITFSAQGERTMIEWRMEHEPPGPSEEFARFLAAANEENLDRLAAHLARREPGSVVP